MNIKLHDFRILGFILAFGSVLGLSLFAFPSFQKADFSDASSHTSFISSAETIRKKVVPFSSENSITLTLPATPKEISILPKGIIFNTSSEEILRMENFPAFGLEVLSTMENTRAAAKEAIKGVILEQNSSGEVSGRILFEKAPPWYTEYVMHWNNKKTIPLEIVPAK